MGYFIIGDGLKSSLVCCFQKAGQLRTIILNSLTPPTKSQIGQYRAWEEKTGQLDQGELGEQSDTSMEIRPVKCVNQ